MYIVKKLLQVFEESVALFYILPIAAGLLTIITIISYACRRKDVFFALSCLLAGGISLSFFIMELNKNAITLCSSLLLMSFGVNYLSLLTAFAIKRKKEIRKKQRAQILRKIQYTLPEKDNTFVRERLNTTLRVNKTEKEPVPLQETEAREIMNLEHVRKLLSKIKNAPLSQAERLETEEMSRMFALYLKKDKWTPSDVRTLNELFSALLKVAAKYSV